MKSNLNIRTILVMAIVGIISFVFLNNSLAANNAKVDVAVANIRENADANSTIIEQAARNEEVEVLEKGEEWYKVKYNNKIGYVKKDLLEGEPATTTEPATTQTPEPTQTPETPAGNPTIEQPTTTETPAPVAETEKNPATETPAPATETPAETKTEEPTKVETETKIEEKTGTYNCKEVSKIKIIPLINGYDIKELALGAKVNVLEINNKWALVDSEGTRGWISTSKIEKESAVQPPVATSETPAPETTPETPKTEEPAQPVAVEKTMYVNSNVINVRSAETKDSDSIDQLKKGAQVTVVSENNGWSKVKVNGKEGYILSTLLTDRKPEVITSRNTEEPRKQNNTATETKKTETKAAPAATKKETTKAEAPASTGSATGSAIVAKAKTYIGCRYVYGGTSPSGFDCSGFAQYIYKQFGISLNRTAAAQYSNGTSVSRGNLQPGDLVMFGSGSSINHVGIYAGNGQIVHAANKQRGVTMDPINSGYYNTHFIGARRIVK